MRKTRHGIVATAYDVTRWRQEEVESAVKNKDKKISHNPGYKVKLCEVYQKEGIKGLNKIACELMRKHPNGITKSLILLWVKDVIKPEDVDKILIQHCEESRYEGDDR